MLMRLWRQGYPRLHGERNFPRESVRAGCPALGENRQHKTFERPIMTNPTPHGQVPARHQYTSDLASKCQGVARCISYNASTHEAQAKHTLLEASHALDVHSIRVHRKRDGLLMVNARGKSRFMTLRERIAYWLLGNTTEIRP